MITPPHFTELRASLPVSDVSFGYGGVHLFEVAELEGGQVGYSVAPDGASLCSEVQGAWKPSWTVIGTETTCGDPLFMDTGDDKLPVFTAAHGEGAWEPARISISLDVFFASFKEFVRISVGRSNPAELDAHPLSDEERDKFLSRISALNNGTIGTEFWDILVNG